MKTDDKQQNVFSMPLNELLEVITEYSRLSRAQKKDEKYLALIIEKYEEIKNQFYLGGKPV